MQFKKVFIGCFITLSAMNCCSSFAASPRDCKSGQVFANKNSHKMHELNSPMALRCTKNCICMDKSVAVAAGYQPAKAHAKKKRSM